jgi:anti-sigma regulatory factor (Ser/Thr protein kinase)
MRFSKWQMNECRRSRIPLAFAKAGVRPPPPPTLSVSRERGKVPLTKRSLVLPASPPSVKLARSWVSKVLEEIGRADLVDAAKLGVSELVTNALIHSQPPLSVRVRGSIDHPRIEVVDSSPVPPQRTPVAPEIEDVDDFNLTTFGRGLDLVAMMSSRWGSDLAHDGRSKSVWFEPSGFAQFPNHLEGEIFAFDPELEDGPDFNEGPRLTMTLLGVPARLFGEMRRYHFEIRRELRLLAMTAPDEYPIATKITEIFVQADHERRAAVGVSGLDQAIADGWESVDLEYSVPASTPATMGRIRDLLREVYQAFSQEHLLALRPPDVLVDLETWYFTEFERQGDGEEPLRWSGPTAMPTA